jgi:Domain of unknown function (DUF4129)
MSAIPDPASALDRGDVPGPRSRGDSPGARAMAVLPFALAVVAEGAWVAAIYALVQAAAHEEAPLGPAGMAVAAAAGLLIARRWGPGLGERWPWVALGLVALASLVGVLASPHAIEALLASGPVEALRANPGGALVGLAFLRGMAHARIATSEEVLDRLMAIGLPALVVPVLLAGTLPEPWRTEATTGAVVAIAVFLVAGTVGLAVTRISAIGGSAGFDWRRNRAWLALVALLAVGIVVAALPAAVVVGPVVRVVFAVTALPLLAVGALAGLGQVSRRAVLSFLVGGIALLLIVAIAGPQDPSRSDTPEGPGSGSEATDTTVVTFAGGGVLVLLTVVGIVVLARLWMREALRPVESDVAEERTIDPGRPERRVKQTPRADRRTRPRHEPTDAAGAYLTLVDDLERRPSVARLAAESPSEHARRLRRARTGALGLDLLAADYELERFAERALSPGEVRRALARWRRLRDSLGRGD